MMERHLGVLQGGDDGDWMSRSDGCNDRRSAQPGGVRRPHEVNKDCCGEGRDR